MKLKGKLFASFAAVVTIVIVGMPLAGLQIRHLFDVGKSIGQDGAPELIAIKEMQISVMAAQLELEELLTGVGGSEGPDAVLAYFREAEEAATAILEGDIAGGSSTFGASDDAERTLLDRALTMLRSMEETSRRILEQNREDGSVPTGLLDELTAERMEFRQTMEEVIAIVTEHIDRLTVDLENTYRSALLYIGISTAVALIAALGVAVLLSNRFSNRVRRMVRISEAAAAGDFTQDVDTNGADELAQMADALNELSDSLSSMISDVRSIGKEVSQTAADVASNSEETAAAANQISTNGESIQKLTENQAQSVQTVSDALDTISEQVEALNQQIEQQSVSVNQSSSSIEEMVANIQSVTKNVERAKSNLADLVRSASEGESVLDSANARVQEMAHQSESMLEANRVIANIAAQTNLLAMNAAIEAAHAGQYGQGFAVVADEIRSLAENASTQSKDVEKQLKSLKGTIDAVADSSQRSLESFRQVRSKIAEVDQLEAEVEASMQEQSAGSSQVLEALSRINTVTEQVRQASSRMKESNDSVRHEMSALVQTSEEVRQSIDEIANGTREIHGSVAHLSEIGTGNKQLVSRLEDALTRFRLRESYGEQEKGGSEREGDGVRRVAGR